MGDAVAEIRMGALLYGSLMIIQVLPLWPISFAIQSCGCMLPHQYVVDIYNISGTY